MLHVFKKPQQERLNFSASKIIIISTLAVMLTLFIGVSSAFAADVTLAWDSIGDSGVVGYSIYLRQGGQDYNYNSPAWTGAATTCMLTDLLENKTYYFVARSRTAENLESVNSNEVSFYYDSDTGFSTTPAAPLLSGPADEAVDVSLTPTFQTQPFSDPETGDFHLKTEWQISEGPAFDQLVFQATTPNELEALILPDLILEPNMTYFWRVRFYDSHDIASPWSTASQFDTVISSPDDVNGDGVPDMLTVTQATDVDNDTVMDQEQADIKIINTFDGKNQIGVKLDSADGYVASLTLIDPQTVADGENRPSEMPVGLVGFKLAVNTGATVQVELFFTETLPDNAGWYKYDLVDGWIDYSEFATISDLPNGGTKVVLELQDGGIGDADGVENGVIVDPSGPGVERSAAGLTSTTIPVGDTASVSSGGGGCFIGSAGGMELPRQILWFFFLLFPIIEAGRIFIKK